MNALAGSLLALTTLGVLVLPWRWLALPLLVGGLWLPAGLGLEIGPMNFYPLRLLLAVALVRLLLRGGQGRWRPNRVDAMIAVWAAVALATAPFHDDPTATLVNRLGLVYTAGVGYLVLRAQADSADALRRLVLVVVIVIVPIGLAMAYERATGFNPFSAFGGVDALSETRGGIARAQGPFAHSILAGSVGAGVLPLVISLWSRHRLSALAGIGASLAMVATSGSTGPMIAAAVGVAGLLAWSCRRRLRLLLGLGVFGLLALATVMNAQVYYLLAHLDLTGTSTSWHRAALIESAIASLPDWWLAGTDRTRQWMPYGVPWSSQQADITNHYLRMGVDGGLPLLLTFAAGLLAAFLRVGRAVAAAGADTAAGFQAWSLGASLLAHAASFMGVSYFDQSVVMLYLTLAAVAALAPGQLLRAPPMPQVRAQPRRVGDFRVAASSGEIR